MFHEILSIIGDCAGKNFDEVCRELEACVNSGYDFAATLRQTSIIPEYLPHDSTEEKLFSKASDMVLARAFRELGLKSAALKERGDSADVLAASKYFGYSLVADAKAFRLSRTAKNQKDFKVSALSGWRKDNDYAVLCAPYFQYPGRSSQIYAQALTHNVCLLSWEHLAFMIDNSIEESPNLNLAYVWSFCENFSHSVTVSSMKNNFLSEFNCFIESFFNVKPEVFEESLGVQVSAIIQRSMQEKSSGWTKLQQSGAILANRPLMSLSPP
ncbi:MAG: HindIII family type II restriction endonuclease [Synergistaceae bacterium]|nr:HindIII family type II restriction endonuclease [Synergistaceae bacterium]